MTTTNAFFRKEEGINSVRVASTSNIAGTYLNGPSNSGVQATFTIAATSLTIDSVACAVNDRVLLAGQTSAFQNGVYLVTSIASTVVLTRSVDFQSFDQMKLGYHMPVKAGTVYAGNIFVVVEPMVNVVGTDSVVLRAAFNSAPNALVAAFNSPDTNANLEWKEISLGQAALASAGKVVIQAGGGGTKQYRVRNVFVNYSSAGLSGNSGDRLIVITDGTTVYNNAGITAALLGTPINTVWGGTGNPLPGTVAIKTATAAGADLYAQYSGGTADYNAGAVSISVLVERIA